MRNPSVVTFRGCAFFCAIALAVMHARVQAQASGPVIVGHAVRWHSNMMNEERTLWVYQPDTSAGSTTRYPVIYVMDGNTYYLTAVDVMRFLSLNMRMPAMIVVGIENSANRTRDLTPLPADTGSPGSGGADAFLRCMREELIPYIDAHYRTAPYRMLIGHSFGGIFAVNALLRHPEMFNSYVVASASLWWGRDTLVNQLRAFFRTPSTLRASVYETVGNEGPHMVPQELEVMQAYANSRVEGLDWKFRLMENDDHGSVVLKSIYDGLEYIFRDWRIQGNDIAELGLKGLAGQFDGLSRRYGFHVEIPEALVNNLGYIYLAGKRMDEAISAFTWNVEHYPGSWNVYDSLGEAYAKAGDTTRAIANYQKSLTLYPGSPSGVAALKLLQAQ